MEPIAGLAIAGVAWWCAKRLFRRRASAAATLVSAARSEPPSIFITAAPRLRPPGQWRQVQPWFDVAGLQHRNDDATAFVESADACHGTGEPYGLEVEREPRNRHDENALAIYGWWTAAGEKKRVQIGYAPRDIARDHRDPLKPIAIEIESLYLAERYDGEGMYVGVRAFILEPSARSGYWNGKAPSRRR